MDEGFALTIGRLVLYRDETMGEDVCPAIVTKVHSARLVDLTVFPPASSSSAAAEPKASAIYDANLGTPRSWSPPTMQVPFLPCTST